MVGGQASEIRTRVCVSWVCVGLFLLLAFWFASWTMRSGAPLLAVTLAGLNVTIIRAGDSLRGYGLGSALAVLTLAVIWRLTCRPSLAAFSWASW